MVSDGSCKDDLQRGSLAFVMVPQPNRALLAHKAVGCNLTTGLPEDQSSCWSELVGISGALSFPNILQWECTLSQQCVPES